MSRILLLTDEMGQGGAERQLSYLAIELKRAGHEVRLVKFYAGENFYGSDLEAHGIDTEMCLDGQKGWKRPFAIANMVRQWHPDLVVTYKDGSSMGACLAKLLTKFNLAVSERNTTQVLSRREKMKFRLYSLADHVVPNSFSQGKFMETNAPWLKSNIKVITNMIDTGKFHPAEEPVLHEVPSVITTARIAPQKNVLVYLDAIKILKDKGVKVHFDWYGRPEHEDYHGEVKRRVNKLGLKDMITFHGSSQNVAQLYRESDVFCLPSIYEGFPNVLCEAMASGLPCVASDVCDNPSILNDDSRRFNPRLPEEIASTIEKLLKSSDSEHREEGIKNRTQIVNLCSPSSFVEKYESLLSNCSN